MTKLSVLIVGFGGVGIIAGYTLERNGKASVTASIRSDFDKACDNGYDIESVDYGTVKGYKPNSMVKSLGELKQKFDYILVTTKNLPDIFSVEDMIAPFVGDNTIIVLSQNGIGIEQPFMKRFPKTIILSCVSMISSNKYVTDVEHVSKDIVKIGAFPNGSISDDELKLAATTFLDMYSNETNECIYDENVKFSRWRKLIYNGSFNSICTLTGIDSGRLEIFGGEESMVRICMKEIIAIAKADGIEFPSDIIETMIRTDDGIWCTPSMMVDSKKGNFIEAEVIVGNPVRIAKEYGVNAPYLTMAYELLKVIQQRTKEEKGMITIPKERPPRGWRCE